MGGACNLLINNAIELKKRGFHIEVVYFGRNDTLLNKFKQGQISISRIKYGGNLVSFFQALLELVKFVRKYEIALIHCNLHADIRFGVLASVITRTPLVVTRHSLKLASQKFGSYKFRILKRFENCLLRRAEKIIAVSEAVRIDQVSHLKKKTVVIHSGVPKFNNGGSKGLNSGYITLLHVGRFDPVKNQLFSLRLAKRLSDRQFKIRLVFVGDTSGQYYQKLCEQIAAYKMEDVVQFAGAVLDVSVYYTIADFVIIPSFSESFGLVAPEAMQLGRIVIAANIPGLNEIMENGKDGFYFTPHDLDEASSLIETLILNRYLANAVTEKARTSFVRKFTIESSVDKLAKLYTTIVESNGR